MTKQLPRPLHPAFTRNFYVLVPLSIASALPCLADEPQRIAVSYLLAPARSLPEQIQTVAITDSGVESDEERRDARERKWQNIAADMIEALVQSGANESVPGALRVVERRATRDILAEKDMQLVGIVEGRHATEAGKLLAVDALVMSRIKISIDYRRSRKQTIDWIGILGGGPGHPPPPRHHRPRYRRHPGDPRYHADPRGGYYNPYRGRPRHYREGPGMGQRTIEEISRDLTVQCSFSLIDANTGEAIIRHAPPIYRKRDKTEPNFLFGGSVDPADLDPVDHFIGELVEEASREFVSMIAPVQASFVYPVELDRKEVRDAVRMMRADEYVRAIRILDEAFRDEPKRTDYLFAIGLLHEITGEPQMALNVYRDLVSLRKVDEDRLDTYLSAKERLTAHMPRILPGPPGQPNGGLVTNDRHNDFRVGENERRDRDEDDDDD